MVWGILHFFIAEDDENKNKLPLEDLEERFISPFMAEPNPPSAKKRL